MTDEEILAIAVETASERFYSPDNPAIPKRICFDIAALHRFSRLVANTVMDEDAALIAYRATERHGWDKHDDAAAIRARKT